MNEMENWVDIKEFEGFYQVSDLGRIRSLDRVIFVRDDRYRNPREVHRKGRVLKKYTDGTDRCMVILQAHGISKWFAVHRIVATHFLPNPSNLRVVNHINHDHQDNRVANLEWCTQSHNIRAAITAGRMDHIYKNKHKPRST